MCERYIYNISNIINNYMGIPVEVTPAPKMLFLSRQMKTLLPYVIIILLFHSIINAFPVQSILRAPAAHSHPGKPTAIKV